MANTSSPLSSSKYFEVTVMSSRQRISAQNERVGFESVAAYRPFVGFAALTLVSVCFPAAFLTFFPRVSETLYALIAHVKNTQSEGDGFVDRVFKKQYTEFMCILLVLITLYALLQLYAASKDYQWFSNRLDARPNDRGKITVLKRFLLGFTGRPMSFYTGGEKGNARKRLAAHLDYGKDALATPLKFFLWAFPMLGFLGTAIGLSDAIRHLPAAMASQKPEDLGQVLGDLAFKFDTTIIGIVSAIFVMILIQLYDRLWENLAMLNDGTSAPQQASGSDE
jgi:MotA/TolQ/ExbB proton channel family